MKLPFMLGTELTGISPGFHLHLSDNQLYSEDTMKRKNHTIANIKRYLKTKHVPYHNVHTDDHCMEVSSKKNSTYEEFKKFSVTTRKALENNFLFPKGEHTVCGGAHIHANMKNNKKFQFELARDLVMRPYLPWIFGEPDEHYAMNVLINQQDNLEWFNSNPTEPNWTHNGYDVSYLRALMLPYDPSVQYDRLSDWEGKNNMFRLSQNYKTLEFRFFEMTDTWEEQELQLHFVCQYLKWMWQRYEAGITTEIKLMYDRDMQKIKPAAIIEQFNELCYDIGVDSEEYKPFIKRNLYPRWHLGRRRV